MVSVGRPIKGAQLEGGSATIRKLTVNGGVLAIGTGGKLTTTDGYIGNRWNEPASITVNGAGATWTLSGGLAVGDMGENGILLVLNGGRVESAHGSSIGLVAGAQGKVTVEGSQSAWTNNGNLIVGRGGAGTLSVVSGGTATSINGDIGSEAGSQGTAAIIGSHSIWTIADSLTVGNAGTGILSVVSGGTLKSASGHVGRQTGSQGTASVIGSHSTWSVADTLIVGDAGTGTLSIVDGGTVNSKSSDIGSKSGSQGTVPVLGAGSTWTIAGRLTVGDEGNGTLVVQNGGTVNAESVLIAGKVGSIGTVNIGAAEFAPGVLNVADVVRFGRGIGTLNFNHNDTSRGYRFAPRMEGTGTLNFLGGVTVLTGNSATLVGNVLVQKEGTLVLNGSLASSTARIWGVLAGNGDIGDVIVESGGRVEPGNSVGTLHVKHNFTMAPGSEIEVEINGEASDRIEVGGRATVNGGSIDVLHDDDSTAPVLPGKTYTVLTTAGGLTVNAPMTVTGNDFPFLSFALSRDTHDGYLTTLRNDVAFASLAATANERAVANALDASGAASPLWRQVVGARAAQAGAAFTNLAGAAFHASVAGILSEQSRHLRDAVTGRLRQGWSFGPAGAALAPSGSVLSYAGARRGTAGPFSADPLLPAWENRAYSLWGQALGSWGKLGSDGNAAGAKHSLGGVISGLDVTVDRAWRVGIAGGYSASSFRAPEAGASGSSDNYHVALYGGGQFGPWGLRTGASFSWHQLETTRRSAVVHLAGRERADYSAGTAQVFGELGYTTALGSVALEPFVGLAYVHVDSGRLTETGGVAGVDGGAKLETAYTTLGLRAATALTSGVSLRAMLGWRHAFGDVTPAAALAFSAGGSPFTLAGAPIARDALVAEAGLDIVIAPNAALGVAYSGQVASSAYDHGVKGNLTWRF